MEIESDIRELFSIKDDSEFRVKVIEVLYNMVVRIRELEDDVGSLVLKDYI